MARTHFHNRTILLAVATLQHLISSAYSPVVVSLMVLAALVASPVLAGIAMSVGRALWSLRLSEQLVGKGVEAARTGGLDVGEAPGVVTERAPFWLWALACLSAPR